MAKKAKNTKHIENADKAVTETGSKKPDISDAFLDAFKSAFTSFDKIEKNKKIELYGDKDYLEQFRTFFTKEHPNLLATIDKKDLPIYIKAIEDKGFSIKNITKNTNKLHEEFRSEDTESHVIEKSLGNLRKFCDDKINNIPDNTFKKFADEVGFTHDTLVISPDGSIKTVDGLPMLWKKFLEKEGITLGKTSAEHAEKILTPDYNPTERLMVTVAITKIRKELKGSLKTAFDDQFSLPIDIFSSYRDLLTFKVEWTQFLYDHASEIDKGLAKKLDDVIVTNGDIYKELRASGRDFDDTKGFSEWEQYFRRIFNNLVTRQLFEEVQKTQDTIDHYITAMGETFKQFPPYVNTILEVYPFNDKNVSAIDTSFHADLENIDNQILDLNTQYADATNEERIVLRQKMKALKQQKEYRRWQAYIAFLRTKDVALADVFAHLVGSKFDFSVLSSDQQQLILDVLVKNKLEDTIKNKVPELLDVKEEELTQFVHDLFDLKKMDLVVPTRNGPVPLTFLKKEFVSNFRRQLPALSDLEDIQNLPLNFVTQLTDSNADFFEYSPIFDSIYTNFAAKNGNFRFNEGYKVTITKDGKPVTGYLSAYCPIDEKYNDKDYDGKELFLYSQPITSPSQERDLVTWPHEEGKPEIPVVIKNGDQASCEMNILDKQLNLNGDAFGALLFGYVLGQQSMNTSLSPEKEKEFADKLGTLNVYKDKEDGEEDDATPEIDQSKEKTPEVSKYKQFYDDFNKLKGHSFPEDHKGFVPGTKLFMPFDSSKVPPEGVGSSRLQMEITHVDTDKGTFKVKIRGGELRLGKSEGVTKELPMTSESLESIKKAFSRDIYKVPDMKGKSFSQQIQLITQGSVAKDLDKHFGTLHTDGSTFSYALGNYSGKEITHFGIYEPKRIGEDVDKESGNVILYKIHPNANGTITVSGDSTKNNYAKHFPARDMDYVSFMLFVKDKGLQPKCKDQIQDIQKKAEVEREETPTTVHGFSINNIVGFFKNGVSKIKDSIKKYDDERTEDLTDTLTSQGQLWGKIGGFLSPFSRISSSFETMGMEYFLERDNRVWKKVEKWQKFYEDYDYTKLYKKIIFPMLDGQIAIVPHYKMAAILLAHLKKGKGPYAKNLHPDKGQWIGVLLGKAHQARYLAIREKRIRDLEENAHVYGTQWADQIKNELVELEMRYIVHVMDGRHMGIGDDNDKTKYYFQDKYSKKFCDTLEETYVPFFKQSTVDEGFTKNQDVNFEFARVEYFRQLADRPQQALPFLKVMATKAINDTQWQVFETAVMVGMLSGVFLNMTFSSTQVYIQKICRTRGFVPGIFARDIHQQSKLQRLLDLYSNNKFTSENKYNPADFSYRKNILPGKFMALLVDANNPGKGRFENPQRMREISDFLCFKGKNTQDKTLLDLYADPKLSMADKLLIEEYIDKSNEKNEGLDPQVQENTSSLTGSILTKSQSVVEQMIKIDQDGFAGKDGDAKYNMEEFSKEMKKAIPSDESISSEVKVDFFVKKFFNWFSVFSGTKKTDLIKRLVWCQKHKGSPEVDDIMYYGVVGEIISQIAHPPAQVPEELEGALNARKDFFINNMDIILRPSVVASSFGPQHVSDLSKASLLEPWENAAILLDREEKTSVMYGLSKDEQKPLKDTQQRLRNLNYINKPLYDLADLLYKRCSVPNRFKKEAGNYANKESINQKSPSTQIKKATGAKIRNPKVIEQVRQILEGKNIEEEPEQYLPMDDFDDNFGVPY